MKQPAMIKKQLLRRFQTLFGVSFIVIIVIGAFVGAELVKRNQDTRQQASGGALPTSDNNMLSVCVIIEKDGSYLEEWDMVPETTFSIKAGPISTSYNPESNTLPNDYESKLESITLHSKDLTNATLENGVNARCHKIGTASPTFLYLEGNIDSSAQWESIKYNDVFNKDVTQFHSYDKSIFDQNVGNDAARNKDADGHISISGRTDRKLVLYAKLNSPLNTPSPTPSPTQVSIPVPTQTTQRSTGTSTNTIKVSCNNFCITSSECKNTNPNWFCKISQNGKDGVCRLESNPDSATCQAVVTNSAPPTPYVEVTNTQSASPPPSATSSTTGTGGISATPTSSPFSNTSTSTTNTTNNSTTTSPTPTATAVLLAQGNNTTPTPTAATFSNAGNTFATPTPTTISNGTGGGSIVTTPTTAMQRTTGTSNSGTTLNTTTTTNAQTQTLDPTTAPVSGNLENTLTLVLIGGSMFGAGMWLVKKN